MRSFLVAVPPVATAGLGVAINFATSSADSVLAWLTVVLLTVVMAIVAVVIERRFSAQSDQSGVSNSVRGKVRGGVVQARDIDGSVNLGGTQSPISDSVEESAVDQSSSDDHS